VDNKAEIIKQWEECEKAVRKRGQTLRKRRGEEEKRRRMTVQ
jgi:hypothetical protein